MNSSFNFGQTPTSTASAFGSAPSFGSSTFGATSLFGQPSNPQQPQQQSLFGAPAPQQPQSNSGFGAFNFSNPANTANTFASPTFGQTAQPAQPATNQAFSFTSTGVPNQPMFGSTGFGAQPQPQPQQATSAGTLFGATAPQPGQSLFGQQTANTNASQAPAFGSTAPMFSSQPAATTTTASLAFGSFTPSFSLATTTQSSASPFGQAATNTFGTASSTTGTGLSFGNAFGTTPSFGTSAPSLGAFNAPVTTASGLGGISLGTNAAPSGGLFNFSSSAPLTSTAFNLTTTSSVPTAVASSSIPSFSNLATTTPSSGLNFGLSSQSLPTQQLPTQQLPTQQFSIQPLSTQPLSTQPQPSTTLASTIPTGSSTLPLNLTAGSTSAAPPSFNFGPSTTSSLKPLLGITTTPNLNTTAPLTTSIIPISTQASVSTITTGSGSSLKPATGFTITSLGTGATTTTSTTSISTSAPVSVPQITFGKLEDQINLWMNELTQFESDFHSQGQTINSWDSLLISNGQKLIEMKQSIEKLKSAHRGLDHQLDFIIAQQKELEQLLDQIEQNKFEISSNNVNAEREHTYSLVETVNNDLNAIGSDLKDFIKKLNETKSNQDSNDPIVQISKILNSHMDVLQWIENQVKNVKINC